MAKKKGITNGERAMFTFFITTLVAPFLAALMVVALAMMAAIMPQTPVRSVAAAGLADLALRAFVWAAMPAGLAAAAQAAWVSLKGDLPWFAAVVAGVVAFGVASVLVPGLPANLGLPFAFVAALSALGSWLVLRRAGIVSGGSAT